MISHILGNKSYPNENNFFSDWQKNNIFRASLESSIWPQYEAASNLWYRLRYYLDIQLQNSQVFL